MNIKYENGNLILGFHQLLELVDAETKVELIESLACDDQIIKHVADQIIDKWTENFCSGGSLCTAIADVDQYSPPLDRAWRRVAKASGDIAKREIERLEGALKRSEETVRELRQENSDLRHQRSHPSYSNF